MPPVSTTSTPLGVTTQSNIVSGMMLALGALIEKMSSVATMSPLPPRVWAVVCHGQVA